MKVCGVELAGNEAIISLLTLNDGLFNIPECRARRMALQNVNSREALQDFQFAFGKLMADYQIEKVVIRQRPAKGKFAGGAIGFKLEAALELMADIDVEVLATTEIKEVISRNPLPVPFAETGLKGFQQTAFTTAFAFLMRHKYQDSVE